MARELTFGHESHVVHELTFGRELRATPQNVFDISGNPNARVNCACGA